MGMSMSLTARKSGPSVTYMTRQKPIPLPVYGIDGMDACASAHHWAQKLQRLGHGVRLIPLQYVCPFVKTNKNDAADAEAILRVGVIIATALVATIGDASQFRSGRQLAAWLGLVPRQHSSGGKDRLGRISKRGDGYIRRLLVHGARTVLRWRRAKPEAEAGWVEQLLERRPTNVVLVAMANKTARIAWVLLRHQRNYQPTIA